MKNDESKANIRFPIRELSARTQVHTVTLRAWERRYGLLKPQRTPKGHRLYSDDDVVTVGNILGFVARGVPLGKVRRLLNDGASSSSQFDETESWQGLLTDVLLAIDAFSVSKLAHIIQETFANYPVPICRDRLIEPLLSALVLRDDHGAASGFVENEIIRYALGRTNTKAASKKDPFSVTLIAGQHAPLWRLALTALELTDADFSTYLFSQRYSVAAAVELANKFSESHVVFYEDGIWKNKENGLIDEALLENTRLFVCGTAAVLANLSDDRRVFANLESCFKSMLKQR
jgi:MerR family transcriptional regulator, light-induced transcriptional regulator